MKAFDLRSWLTGFALGFSGKPLPLSTGKTPIAYSYNGTVLPKLPEWDREQYPYAYIDYYDSTGNSYSFFVTSKPLRWYAGGFVIGFPLNDPDALASVFRWRYRPAYADGWYETGESDNAGIYYGGVWTNTDIYYPDDYSDETLAGTLFLAASEPVPVYE